MLQFFLLVNKQGQTRLSQYYENIPLDKRINMEGEIVRKCLSRTDSQVYLYFYIFQFPPYLLSPPITHTYFSLIIYFIVFLFRVYEL